MDAEGHSQRFWQAVWEDNKGAILILLGEVFGAVMDANSRYLQQQQGGGAGFHVFQIIVFRMGITFLLCLAYMWWTKVPNFPFGAPDIRLLLVLRALFGFVGLFALYYSLHYLPLAEATVLRFLIPLATAWACHILLGQSFTNKQLTAGLLAMVGVVVIAQPEAIFGRADHEHSGSGNLDTVTPAQRLLAIVVSLIGVIGGSGAYTIIRVIGNRAHALLSVSYFAFIATASSSIFLLVIPGIGFVMPRSAKEWALLSSMGFLGFALQFLLTTGLQLDKSPKATSMLYSQVVFALSFDWAIWGVLPSGWSWVGGAIVVASTLWSTLQKTRAVTPAEAARKVVVDEETALLGAHRPGIDGEESGPVHT
ncbi:hypothetical protein BD289DRAFT_367216 [Coniella lustricola]|uniref:EamA domain-containing protein n=1 Tax=Coniella lustricola TaxID=2025994 RepID=A0A2T3A9U6_9PEZI|nr:hypothetical protein BD289DRAFT_367216 [Coniella lustricola]